MQDTFALSIQKLRNPAWRTHVQTMRTAFKDGFEQQNPKLWLRAESLIRGKKGPSPLRTFFVLECLDALENATLAQQRLAGAAFKLACAYTKKGDPSLRKRCYKAALRTVLNLAESTTPTSTLPLETAASLRRGTSLILNQLEALFPNEPLRQRGILTLSLVAAKNTAATMPGLATQHLERAARMAGPSQDLQTEVLAACVTHYKDILFHATAADKARTPLTALISTLSGIDIVTEGFEAQGLVIPPQTKKRPFEAFVLGRLNDSPPNSDKHGHIVIFEMLHNVGTLRTEPPYKAPKLLKAAEELFAKALAAPSPLEALAGQIEKSSGKKFLAKDLRLRAAYTV